MRNFTDLTLKAETIERFRLPDIPYPVAADALDYALESGGGLPFAAMLHGLQQRSDESGADWMAMEPAMERLAELIADDDNRETLAVSGEGWWIEIGPVDLGGRIVTIQRRDHLIAAIEPLPEGRLRVSVFRPLDAKSARYLTELSRVPQPEGGVCMRDNNWEYALDCSAGTGNFYAFDQGFAHLSYWSDGSGVSSDGTDSPEWILKRNFVARPAARVAAELKVHERMKEKEVLESVSQDEPEDGVGLSGVEESEADPDPISNEVSATTSRTTDPSRPRRWKRKRQIERTLRGRFHGCLLGGAVGDALGAPVEFMKRSEILQEFGSAGITGYAPVYGGLGRITDDTQMTLFTAEGLIRSLVRLKNKGITSFACVTAHAYLRWLETQGERPKIQFDFAKDETGWLFQQPELHSRRAPGNTCLLALREMSGLGDPAMNNSKGCGGVMRMAPVGLLVSRAGEDTSPEEAFEIGTELARLTHGHPTGSLTGGVLAVLILALVEDVPLLEAIAAAKDILRGKDGYQETFHAIELAENTASSGMPHDLAIARLGKGWIAEQALGISIYCALVARSYKEGVMLAVNHDGDSDSTGAIVGNLLGAMHGVKAIPSEWLEPLELRGVISELADDLYDCPNWRIGPYTPDEEWSRRIWEKYPGF
ncbi:MAG: ADP-ribosylglycohydrolase family protein [Akkermansiaceae bacterium]|nr:ADP-ribosylglycohydrolase family protein [Akkermansiaceae bacterium]